MQAMQVSLSDIPGLVEDNSPERPAYKPRFMFERSAPAIRAALAASDEDALAEFERDFHAAMVETDHDFDLGRMEKLVHHWWLRAMVYLDVDRKKSIDEAIARFDAGDESVFNTE